jgi:hypothetical protein
MCWLDICFSDRLDSSFCRKIKHVTLIIRCRTGVSGLDGIYSTGWGPATAIPCSSSLYNSNQIHQKKQGVRAHCHARVTTPLVRSVGQRLDLANPLLYYTSIL